MIYFVAKNIGLYGGAAVVAMDVVDSMIDSNIEFRTICSQYKVPEERADKLASISRLKMPYLPEKNDYPNTLNGLLRFMLKSGQQRFESLLLDREIRKLPPELMIFNGYKPSTMALIKRYSNFCKTVHIIHVSPNYVDKFEDFITLKELLDVYKEADSLIFVSDECRKAWLELELLDPKKAHYIPNCAKEDTARECMRVSKAEMREKLNFKEDKFYLVNVASIKKRKGQDILIDAAPEMKKIAPDLEILIVGSGGGKYLKELHGKVKEHNLDYIRFEGHKSNAMEYVYGADLFVLPSRAEAFPLALLEAMILKTPAIGANVDGVPEMIEEGKTGLLFESENTDGLVQAFEKMYNNSDARDKYREEASGRYWDRFSKEKFTMRYSEILNHVLHEN